MRIKDLLKSSCQSLMDVLKYAEDAEYQFIWTWQLDQVQLGRFRTITLDLEKLVEARIFTEGKEIHIFDFEGEWKAVEVTTEEDSIYQDEIQILKENNRKLTIRHYIDFDTESSQAYICGSCLNGWEE